MCDTVRIPTDGSAVPEMSMCDSGHLIMIGIAGPPKLLIYLANQSGIIHEDRGRQSLKCPRKSAICLNELQEEKKTCVSASPLSHFHLSHH